MRYVVRVVQPAGDGNELVVDAEGASVEEGVLAFSRRIGAMPFLVASFAPGQWLWFHEEGVAGPNQH